MPIVRDAERVARAAIGWALVIVLCAATWLGGCGSRVIGKPPPEGTSGLAATRIPSHAIDKVDLLLVIDNSRSMADKQELLSVVVPDLVRSLTNPRCLLPNGTASAEQPTDPLAECPEPGSKRETEPILDVHIGVITSSLGSHGSDACDTKAMTSLHVSVDDQAHLIDRSGTDAADPTVPTYQGLGFLVWDPDAESPSHNPPGETNIDTFVDNLTQMVVGAGEVGCGYESTLEAWYRFLVEPAPYESITIEDGSAVLEGIDRVIVGDGPNNPGQRQLFLRPDSLLAIIMLSDENDCSIRDGGQFYFASQIFQPGTSTPYHLPKPRAACASDPNDPCCRSCGQSPGDGCDTSQDDCSGSLSDLEDNINLRCYDQKRRFGVDFLWPIDRYVAGLTEHQVTDRYGNVADNPLFTDLVPSDQNSAMRDPSLVFIAGIVGVPWQDLARQNESGTPDLLAGLDAGGRAVGGLQSGAELAANGTWDVILGDPSCYATSASCLPTDPHMIESVDPRTGENPITGDAIAPSTFPLGSNINGHEYTIDARDDLQYACIFDLATPRDCATMNSGSCDCGDPNNDNPLCYDGGVFGTTQVRAKAYPGIRHLQVLEGMGSQGIVGSVCPAQRANTSSPDFGYRPSMSAAYEGIRQGFAPPCLSSSLAADASGRVSCRVFEAFPDCPASCAFDARSAVAGDDPARDAIAQAPGGDRVEEGCLCEITQLDEEGLQACQADLSDFPVSSSGTPVHGWCYLDATAQPPIGDPELVAACPQADARILRFVGNGAARSSASLWLVCSTE